MGQDSALSSIVNTMEHGPVFAAGLSASGIDSFALSDSGQDRECVSLDIFACTLSVLVNIRRGKGIPVGTGGKPSGPPPKPPPKTK